MGEVRTQAKITNATDEDLVRRGQLQPDEVRSYLADALVDTGAVRTVVPSHVVQTLGITIRGQRVAEYADGRHDVAGITGPLVVEVQGRARSKRQ